MLQRWAGVALVKKLVAHGANVNLVGGPQRRTVLHWAAHHVRPPICRALLEAGADASVVDGGGRTPLQVAELASASVRRVFAPGHLRVSLADVDATLAMFKGASAGGGGWRRLTRCILFLQVGFLIVFVLLYFVEVFVYVHDMLYTTCWCGEVVLDWSFDRLGGLWLEPTASVTLFLLAHVVSCR